MLQGGSRYITGEAPVAGPKMSNHVVQPQALGALGNHIPPQKALPGHGGAIVPFEDPAAGGLAGKAPRKRTRAEPAVGDNRHHNMENGRYTTNRKGDPLCAGWQKGTCMAHNVANRACAANPKLRHQCDLCLSDSHGADHCDKGKAGGKGKGKQGKGKGKHRQY